MPPLEFEALEPASPRGAPPFSNSSVPHTFWRRVAVGCMVAAGCVFVIAIYWFGLTPAQAANRDYIQYWAAGQQLVRHADPYDVGAILRLERAAGLRDNSPCHTSCVSFSPPVALEFALPLGWLNAKAGLIAWVMVEMGCVVLSCWLLWRVRGRPDSRLHLLGMAFAPVIACIMEGQLGIFFLLSLTLFLALHRTHPFLAGAMLMPLALKPHLVVPFAVALLVWCVARRRSTVLAGGLCGLAASCAVSLAIDPHAWAQYSKMTSQFDIADLFVPTVSILLRDLVYRPARWLGYVPIAVGSAWAAWYAWKRRRSWSWLREGQLVVMISILCAPYSWFFDQCLLLPAVLMALYDAANPRRALLLFLAIDGVLLVEIMSPAPVNSNWYLWTAPAWLAWYLYGRRDMRMVPQTT